jgi:septal ring factor EnvC (AmiA/AmiB activator)
MNRFFVLFFFVFCTGLAFGQSLNELRSKKQKTSEEIQYTNKLLEEARKNERSTVTKLNLLNKQIELRNSLISGINAEVDALSGYIDDNAWVVQQLSNDLGEIKADYAEMVRLAQKNRSSYDKIMFVLSANSFNQAYKRMSYLRQYTDYRRKQAEIILSLKDLIEKKVAELEKQRAMKRSVLQEKQNETNQLNREKQQQNKYINELKGQQNELRKKLRQQQQIEEQLSREIERIIEEEARKAMQKQDVGKTKQTGSVSGGMALTPEQKLVAGKFEKNRGRLPWPVERGVITDRFGVHAHPIMKNIQIKNNGIDITTARGMAVRAVFDGEVSRVFVVSGGNMAVIVRHGSYLTVYSNLTNIRVKAGEKVTTKQEIGTVYSDPDDGKSVLKFQIWKENQKLDPEDWIAR